MPKVFIRSFTANGVGLHCTQGRYGHEICTTRHRRRPHDYYLKYTGKIIVWVFVFYGASGATRALDDVGDHAMSEQFVFQTHCKPTELCWLTLFFHDSHKLLQIFFSVYDALSPSFFLFFHLPPIFFDMLLESKLPLTKLRNWECNAKVRLLAISRRYLSKLDLKPKTNHCILPRK